MDSKNRKRELTRLRQVRYHAQQKKTIKRVKTINSVVNSEGSELTINLSESVLHHTSGNIQDCDDFLNISGSDGDDADKSNNFVYGQLRQVYHTLNLTNY